MTDIKQSKRGTYVKLEDVRFIAGVIRDRELYLRSPSSRPIFLCKGKIYPYSEVARRKHRAKLSGTWNRGSNSKIPQPSHIQIVSPGASPSRSDESSTDDCKGSWDITSPVQTPGWKGKTESSPDYYSPQLVFLDDTKIFNALCDPPELQIAQRLCYNISAYLSGAKETGRFTSNEAGELVSSSSADSFSHLSDFYKCCIVAIELWDKQYWQQGTILLGRAMLLAEVVLVEKDPKLLDVLCDLCILLPTKGYGPVYGLLQDKLCSMVELKTPEDEKQQPWAQMFACIKSLSSTEIVATLQQSWKCGYDSMERLLPEDPWDAINISCYSNYRLRIGENVQQHWDTLLTRSTQQQSSDVGDIQRQFACGKILYLRGDYHEALVVMEYIISLCSQARQQRESKWNSMEIEALEVSARCHFAIYKLASSIRDSSIAESLLANALELSKTTHGDHSATTIALQHTLWLWLLEQGRHSEADQLRTTIDYLVIRIKAPE
jgi:hypothetical protein